jgi:hypothetical protein
MDRCRSLEQQLKLMGTWIGRTGPLVPNGRRQSGQIVCLSGEWVVAAALVNQEGADVDRLRVREVEVYWIDSVLWYDGGL